MNVNKSCVKLYSSSECLFFLNNNFFVMCKPICVNLINIYVLETVAFSLLSFKRMERNILMKQGNIFFSLMLLYFFILFSFLWQQESP